MTEGFDAALIEFVKFPEISRYSRDCIVTEKLDGTNGQIYINPEGSMWYNDKPMPFMIGSRSRWITPDNDNHGFVKWALENAEELLRLGPGYHFGEWWGRGINRGYGLKEKRFSLFNIIRWDAGMFDRFKVEAWIKNGAKGPKPEFKPPPACCHVIPVLWKGEFPPPVYKIMHDLWGDGSHAAPGYMNPEGIVIFHRAGNILMKKTFVGDEGGKTPEVNNCK